MQSFQYERPHSLAEALELLAGRGEDARLLAGGTDLLVQMRHGRHRPQVVVDLKGIAELEPGIVEDEGGLRVSARATLAELVADERVRTHFPALVEAARQVGSVQIRNRATLAGNVCNASPAADTAPPLYVYRAVVHIAGRQGKRYLPVDEFFQGPGRTALERGELVTWIELPYATAPVGAAFKRLTRRRGVDLATISACCLVKESGETLLALGAAAPTPVLARDDSGILADPHSAPAEKERVLADLIGQTSPIDDVRASKTYREAMLVVLSRRALETALARLHGAAATMDSQ